MIRSFRSADARELFDEGASKKFRSIERVALRKLIQVDRAKTLRDLALPGNQLEALKRERKGQHAIRVSERYRLCFVWKEGDAFDVEITDYH